MIIDKASTRMKAKEKRYQINIILDWHITYTIGTLLTIDRGEM